MSYLSMHLSVRHSQHHCDPNRLFSFQIWYSKTPLGQKRALALMGPSAEKEKDKGKAKKGEKDKKKKKKK